MLKDSKRKKYYKNTKANTKRKPWKKTMFEITEILRQIN